MQRRMCRCNREWERNGGNYKMKKFIICSFYRIYCIWDDKIEDELRCTLTRFKRGETFTHGTQKIGGSG
jgi:hypothetical protein